VPVLLYCQTYAHHKDVYYSSNYNDDDDDNDDYDYGNNNK